MNLAEILAKRSVAVFPIGEVKPASKRLLEILPRYGVPLEKLPAIIDEFYDAEMVDGVAFKLRRITATEEDRLKPIVKKLADRTFDHATRTMKDGQEDERDVPYVKLAFAILEPAFPDGMELAEGQTEDAFQVTIRKRADYLKEALSYEEATELLRAVKELNSFNLRRAQEQVKN